MQKHPVLLAILTSVLLSLTILIGMYTDDVEAFASIFYRGETEVQSGVMLTLASQTKIGEWSYCVYDAPDEVEHSVELTWVDVNEAIMPGDIITVNMTLTNNGNTRLYSEDSNCRGKLIVNLGTQNETDRSSIFGLPENALSGWSSPNRIVMEEKYVDPGEEFHVMFSSTAPEGDNIYREFFQPVIEGYGWVDEAFILDIEVGNPTESMRNNIAFVAKTALNAADLEGLEKSLTIDLSDQLLTTYFGDIPIWSMTISSGKWKTPTPPGTYSVIQRQELRIGGAYPHYRMPYWLGFRWDGYGIHALPYLANDGGTFWSEALTHIGIPVSHGCVRVLPDDARTLFEFAYVGMPVIIVR